MFHAIKSAVARVLNPTEHAKTGGVPRSPHWPAVRRAHLKAHPDCAACGRTEELQVHHRRPFHLHPSLELEPTNLITLCEGDGRNCHYTFGHTYSWKSFDPDVQKHAAEFRERVAHRP